MRNLIVLILGGAWGLEAAGLEAVRKVYLMPMGAGLDQYLAETITREGVFTVVVDPKQADAVWSERIDAKLAAALDEMRPPAKSEAVKKEGGSDQAPRRAAGSPRGTLFLVEVASRQVLWSTFRPIEDTSPKALHRLAQEVIKSLCKTGGPACRSATDKP